ncbi:MAG: tetratricopeptide repeat protein [Chitinophagales bacterium]|nr:tetratricopeptide repeat protein [Chitinophagales bacterium]MDW8419875.1 tetratricopeptide repeat protein [Chitinophagales bacterium]
MNRITLFLLTLTVTLAAQSCKQCKKDKQAPLATQDTLHIPGLQEINAEIARDSTNPFLYFKRAQLYQANDQLKSALTDMFIALSLDSLRPEFYLYAAELFKQSGEPKRGIALMDKAITTDSLHTPYYVKAAELAYIDTTLPNNFTIALQYLNTAIGKDPQNADIYFFKGNVYKELKDTLKAISNFQTATELNPRYYDAYVQIGLLLKQRNDKNAVKYLDNAIKVKEKPEDALYAKANMLKEEGLKLYDSGKTDEAVPVLLKAIDAFKEVIRVNHRNAEAYMGAAFCYYQLDSVQMAYQYYDMAIKVAPLYAGAYFSKGLCAEDLGKKSEAMMLYQNCLNIDPNFTRAKEHLEQLRRTP